MKKLLHFIAGFLVTSVLTVVIPLVLLFFFLISQQNDSDPSSGVAGGFGMALAFGLLTYIAPVIGIVGVVMWSVRMSRRNEEKQQLH
ncbi:hypothetical protein [Priestia koreensis]|uniref:hypothetical protein n=1 Tax=Priestia koreensis TaxID=284581 RepID=UPI0028F70463|nr:hypothetical protein [Priestia koreensis]